MTNPFAKMLSAKTRLPLIALLMLLPLTSTARADGRVVREFVSADLDPRFVPKPPGMNPHPATGLWTIPTGNGVYIEAVEKPADDIGRTITVLTLANPGITQTRYFLIGNVEYKDVDGKAYLEMWSDFPDGGHFFSRTMANAGSMMTISGTSAKRPFMLPFNNEPGKVPNKLTLNVVLPGKGTVSLSRIRLVENGEPATAPATQPATGPAVSFQAEIDELVASFKNLPPDAAAAKRKQLEEVYVGRIGYLNTLRADSVRFAKDYGTDSFQFKVVQKKIQVQEEKVAAMKQALDEVATTTGPIPTTLPSLAGLPPEAVAQLRQQMTTELVALINARSVSALEVDNMTGQLGAGHRKVVDARNSLATLDRRIDALKLALADAKPAEPKSGTATLTQAAVTAALTPSDVTRTPDGEVTGFTYGSTDPTGTRGLPVRVYQRGSTDFPAVVRGRLKWHGVKGPPARVGYCFDGADGQRGTATQFVSPVGWFTTTGPDGESDFTLPVVDRRALKLTVLVLVPGPGQFEIDLPTSLSPAAGALAWADRHFVAIFGTLVAVSLLLIVPLKWLTSHGRGRSIVVGVFGLMFAGGVIELFAAGVALGMGRPADAWVTLLGGAAILIVCGGLMLRQVRAQYSGFELRKLRAMDVG